MAAQRDKNGRWIKGSTPNPAGRPVGGGPNKKLRDAIKNDLPGIIQSMAMQAKAGDVQAAKLLLDKMMPNVKAEARPVSIPGIGQGSLTDQAQAALNAAGAGDAPPDIAAQLVSAIGQQAKITEISDLERRIAQLEAQRNA